MHSKSSLGPCSKKLPKVSCQVACTVVARKLVHIALQQHKRHVAAILSMAKTIKSLHIRGREVMAVIYSHQNLTFMKQHIHV